MKKPRVISAIILITATALFASGCNLFRLERRNPEITAKADETAQITAFPVTIGGTEITASPTSVVSLSPAITEIIAELGFGGTIVGKSRYCDYPDLSAVVVGSALNPDIAAISTLKPELVLSLSPIAEKDIKTLSKGGTKAISLSPPTDLDGLKQLYTKLSAVFNGSVSAAGKAELAFAPITDFSAKTSDIQKLSYAYITKEGLFAGADSAESGFLALIGENAISDKGYAVSAKLAKEPQFLIADKSVSVDELGGNAAVSALEAYKSNRIIFIDTARLERPTARLAALYEQILADAQTVGESNNNFSETE